MGTNKSNLRTTGCFFAVSLLALPGCISEDSELLEVTEGCEELQAQNIDGADVDPLVREFMRATLQLDRVSHDTASAVLAACSNIALDLGASDSWSQLEGRAQIRNEQMTGACDVAHAEIAAVVEAAVQADANLALAITEGACHPNFEMQAQCEASCAAQTECTPGSIETRCEPADLSVQCNAACSAEALCEGTPERPANCMGQCEAACQGECKGSCIAPDGSITENDPNCMGKCSSGCNGTCRGLCKVEQPEGIDCGSEVSCRGGCTGEFTEPRCTSEFIPPSCNIDEDCYASCAAEASANAICEPPQVEVYADVSVMANGELTILIDTLEANLPTLLAASKTQGRLAVNAVNRLATTAENLANEADTLGGKSLACAGAAADVTFEAALDLEASFEASGSIVTTTTAKAQ